MDNEELNSQFEAHSTTLRSRLRSRDSFSEGFNANATKLSHITCYFCKPIIQFLYNFRLQEEEQPLEQIPRCYKIREDDIRALTQRGDSCGVCELVCDAMVEEACNQPNSRFLEDGDLHSRDWEICWEFNHSFADPRPVLCVGNGSLSVYFKFRESQSSFLGKVSHIKSDPTTGNAPISYEVLYRWYEACLDHGGTLQDELIVGGMRSSTIRLIDVNDYRICDASTTEMYLALSYVWGAQSIHDDDKLTAENRSLLYEENTLRSHLHLSSTVRDAIEVTRELGFRYLFVDRLCIIQDSSEDKTLYVTAMHEIYNRAQITIVAASGIDAHSGLPGTSETARATSHLLHSARRCINIDFAYDLVQVYMNEFPTSKLMEKHLQNTVWATRGWTYQEEKLSDRLLIFTDQAVFWKCRHLCLYENCPYEQNEMLSTNLKDLGINDAFGRTITWWIVRNDDRESHPLSIERIVSEDARAQEVRAEFNEITYDRGRDIRPNTAFQSCIIEFTKRKLTYQSDIANAFNGMIEAFKAIHKPLPIHHGMFARSLPAELLWACAGCVYQLHPNHCTKRNCLDRRGLPSFPTWSWLAWQGQPDWSYGQRSRVDRTDKPSGHFREMDEPVAMTSSIYAGVLVPPVTMLVYQETRPIGWHVGGEREFVPPRSMTRHALCDRAIMFVALSFPSNWRLNRGPFRNLADLGLQRSAMCDVSIVEWLQTPSDTMFAQPVNVICLSYTRSFYRYETESLAVMMLVSLQTVDGLEVAFREGLFTCKISNLNDSMKEKWIFLC